MENQITQIFLKTLDESHRDQAVFDIGSNAGWFTTVRKGGGGGGGGGGEWSGREPIDAEKNPIEI